MLRLPIIFLTLFLTGCQTQAETANTATQHIPHCGTVAKMKSILEGLFKEEMLITSVHKGDGSIISLYVGPGGGSLIRTVNDRTCILMVLHKIKVIDHEDKLTALRSE
jgi:hypothetical protein